MKIQTREGEKEVFVKNSSYTHEEINGQHIAYLEFDTLQPVPLTINDSIRYKEQTYYIRYKENVRKTETSRGYSYQVTFYHELYRLQDVAFTPYQEIEFKKNTSTFRSTAAEVMERVVKSMKRAYPHLQWDIAGKYPETDKKTFNFKDKTCAEVINDLAGTYNIEYWLEKDPDKNTTFLQIGKRGDKEDNPAGTGNNTLTLKQGEGFRNLTLQAVDDTPPITRLYAYGSDKNLTADYGDYLLLPGRATYIEENTGKYGIIEHTRQFENIFPKGEFRVSEKVDDLTFTSVDIKFNLKECLIDGMEAIITFQDGDLAGYDLAINADKSDFEAKKITLTANQEENALTVPGDINFKTGDMFIITGIKMPKEYIEKASGELQEEARKWLNEKCENRVQLKGDCDEIYFAENKIELACGYMVNICDEKLQINREIRVTAVKRYIEEDGKEPYRYEIILSDFLQTNGFGQIINEIKDIPNKIDKEINPVKEQTKRTWQDARRTLEMLFNTESDLYTNVIYPLAVQTAGLLVGQNSQQFALRGIKFQPNYNNNPHIFKSTEGYLEHFTIDDDGIRTWQILAYSHNNLENADYYVYAKCNKSADSGNTILLSTEKIKLNDDADFYHFLIGILNKPVDGVRSWQPNFGFTEIAGNQITTGVIKEQSGNQYWDMIKSKFRIGNGETWIDFNSDDKGELKLKGTLVQHQSGAVDYLEIDRGYWMERTEYFPGDKVKYYEDGNIYKCKEKNTGELPTKTKYWKLLVTKGDKGDTGQAGKPGNDGKPGKDGQGYKYAYYASDSVVIPSTPPIPGTIPTTWMSSPAFNGKQYIYVSQCTSNNGVWSAWTSPTVYSVMPKKGDPGPAIVFRGWYIDPKDNSNTLKGQLMYNNTIRRDVVKVTWDNEKFYYHIYNGPDATPLPGTWDDTMWENFGSQFDSIATNLLLAENANVGGWMFKNERLESQTGGAFLNGNTGEVNITGKFTSNKNGDRVIIDPNDLAEKILLKTSKNQHVANMGFYSQTAGRTMGRIQVFEKYDTGGSIGDTTILPRMVSLNSGTNMLHLAATDNAASLIFDSKTSFINLGNLPTSDSGLQIGQIYRDGNVIKIKI